jgi:hypothetical protein
MDTFHRRADKQAGYRSGSNTVQSDREELHKDTSRSNYMKCLVRGRSGPSLICGNY